MYCCGGGDYQLFLRVLTISLVMVSFVSALLITNDVALITFVPFAVLLSAFTDNAKALILGTDIGGLGTPIASMASLISFKIYCGVKGADSKKYIGQFLVLNFVLLALFCGLAMLVL